MSKIELLQDLENQRAALDKQRAALEKKISDVSDQVKALSDITNEIKNGAKKRGLSLRDIALAISPELNPDERAHNGSFVDHGQIDMSYISFNRTHYTVRVKRLRLRVSFHITSTVTKEQALQKAIEYRDSLYLVYDLPSSLSDSPVVRVNSRHREDGLSGVHLEIERRAAKNYGYFNCKYFSEGKWNRKRFNIGKLGYVSAWNKAVALRLKHHPIGSFGRIEIQRPTQEQYLALKDVSPDVPNPS